MTIEELQKQNETLTARLEKAKAVFKEQAAKIKELEERAAGNVAIASDDGEKDALKAKVLDLETRAITAETERLDAVKKVKDLEAEAADLKDQLDAATDKIEALEKKAGTAANSEDRINDLTESYNALKASFNKAAVESEKQLYELTEKLKASTESYAALKGRFDKAADAFKEADSKRKDAEENADSLRAELVLRDNRIVELMKTGSECEELEKKNDELEKRLADAEAAYKEQERVLNEHKKAAEAFMSQSAEKEKALLKDASEIEELTAQVKALQEAAGKNDDWKKKYELRAEAIDKANKDAKAMTTAYNQSAAELKRVQGEYERKSIEWGKERDDMKAKLAAAGAEADELKSKLLKASNGAKAFFDKVKKAYEESF